MNNNDLVIYFFFSWIFAAMFPTDIETNLQRTSHYKLDYSLLSLFFFLSAVILFKWNQDQLFYLLDVNNLLYCLGLSFKELNQTFFFYFINHSIY